MVRHRTTSGRPAAWLAAGTATAITAGLLASVPAVGTILASGSGPQPARGGPGWQAIAGGPTGTGVSLADVSAAVGATSPAATGLDGSGIGVALIDTGVAPVPGLPSANVVNGPDLSFESQGPTVRYLDSYGHGTHMAGIIAGNDPSTGFRGLAPGVKLTSIKVGTYNGAADVTQVMAALDWVVAHRNDDPLNPIRVVNLSYGTTGPVNTDYVGSQLALAAEVAWQAGIVVVVAGGNQGNLSTKLTQPAIDPFVLSVGSAATKGTADRSDDEVSTFTNLSAIRNVDLVAPGESIASLRNEGSHIDLTYPGARVGDRLFKGSGSSQATAVVSGAVALLLQKRPDLTPDQVKSLLKATATPITVGIGATQGLGELSLDRALPATVAATAQVWSPSAGSGFLNATRGNTTVKTVVGRKTSTLSGDKDIFAKFVVMRYSAASRGGTAWQGGVWMGHRFAGDGWTGSSWASKTWAPATWSGGDWAGQEWVDPSWSGRHFSGGKWSSTTSWSGRYFSGENWASAYWG